MKRKAVFVLIVCALVILLSFVLWRNANHRNALVWLQRQVDARFIDSFGQLAVDLYTNDGMIELTDLTRKNIEIDVARVEILYPLSSYSQNSIVGDLVVRLVRYCNSGSIYDVITEEIKDLLINFTTNMDDNLAKELLELTQ